jgi:DNA-binding transcriptional ArsR family regulator
MNVSAAFTALADPTRRQIIAFLADGEQPVAEICEQFNCTAPAVSQHLKVLRDTGLVTVRPAAQRRFYAVNKDAIGQVAAWLKQMARLEP